LSAVFKLSSISVKAPGFAALCVSPRTPDGPHQPPLWGHRCQPQPLTKALGRGIAAAKSEGNASAWTSYQRRQKTLAKAALPQQVTHLRSWSSVQQCQCFAGRALLACSMKVKPTAQAQLRQPKHLL